MIWFQPNLKIDDLKGIGQGTMGEYLGIEWYALGADFLQARMPVDHRTKQPYGLLHGGASCVLAETIGSVASSLVIDTSKFYCVGMEINANHLRSVSNGWVIGTATPLHLGKTTHVWDIKIYNEKEKLVCVSRLTVAILKHNQL
jgi:1,4-dihydroxy-2-naphthoyl-CoA hydrolase